MYIKGVSTRDAEAVMSKFCLESLSSSQVSRAAKLLDRELEAWRNRPLGEIRYLLLDARYEKVRAGGVVRDDAVLSAIGVGPDQRRRVLGVSCAVSEAEVHWRAFLAKWRPRCRGVAESLEDAGERLFTFLRYPPGQWKSLRTTNAIERLHEEFKRRIKTQCALPNAETAAMLFWALMAPGQITMRRVDGWQTLGHAPLELPIDRAA